MGAITQEEKEEEIKIRKTKRTKRYCEGRVAANEVTP